MSGPAGCRVMWPPSSFNQGRMSLRSATKTWACPSRAVIRCAVFRPWVSAVTRAARAGFVWMAELWVVAMGCLLLGCSPGRAGRGAGGRGGGGGGGGGGWGGGEGGGCRGGGFGETAYPVVPAGPGLLERSVGNRVRGPPYRIQSERSRSP